MEPIVSKAKYVYREINDLKDMLEQVTALHSESEAFIKKAKDVYVGVSYKKYKGDVFGLGTEFLKRNIKGEKVILLSENRYEWCVTFMATVCSEGIIVPFSPDISENELVSRINNVKGKFIVFSEKYRDVVRNIRKKCPTLEYTIDMDTIIDDDENLSLLRLIELGSKAIGNGETDFAKLEVNREAIAGIFYGNTIIKNKAVMLSHKNLASEIMGIVSSVSITENDKTSAFLSFSEVSHCVADFLAINNQGGTIYFAEKNKNINEVLEENEPTIIFLSDELLNRMYNNMLDFLGNMPRIRKMRLLMFISTILIKFNIDLRKKLFKDILKTFGKNLKSIVLISRNVKSKILKEFYNLGIETIQCYEVIEASGIVMLNNKREFMKAPAIGLPIPGLKASIMASSNKLSGEITLKGNTVMTGYYDDRKATKKVIDENILYTGKNGVRDKSGYFYEIIVKK